jgi:hypothetical protein
MPVRRRSSSGAAAQFPNPLLLLRSLGGGLRPSPVAPHTRLVARSLHSDSLCGRGRRR